MASELDLRSLLLGQSAITNLVGSAGVFCDSAEESDLPAYAVISLQGVDPKADLQQTVGIEFAEIDIDCYAQRKPLALQLANAIREFLKDYSGTAGSGVIHAVNYLDRGTDVVTASDGSKNHFYVYTDTYVLQWE